MSSIRSGSPGATRVCPHCKATVLETAAICPGCRHHLRFSADASLATVDAGYTALSVDGNISHKVSTEPCEYFVVLDIRDERDQQLARQVIGVGVLQPGEQRRLNVSVGMRPVRAQSASRASAPQPASSHAGNRPGAAQPSAAAPRAPQPSPAVESRLQPRPQQGKPTGAGTTGGSNPRFRNFHKP
jgi:hypothetical protein